MNSLFPHLFFHPLNLTQKTLKIKYLPIHRAILSNSDFKQKVSSSHSNNKNQIYFWLYFRNYSRTLKFSRLMSATYQKAKKIRNKKNGLKAHKSYSYECPITLCQSIEFNDTVTLHYHIIEIETSSSFLVLLTTQPISEIPDFKLYIANKQGDWKNNERLYKIYSEMRELQRHSWAQLQDDSAGVLFGELFSEEKVRLIPLGKREFNKQTLNVYFKYYIRFYSDVYLIPSEKIATSFFSFTEKPQGGDSVNKRTYLILPGTAQHTIDEQQICEFLEYKKNIRTLAPGESVAEKINSLKGNHNILHNVLNASIFESYYGNNAKYYCVDIILEPQVQKAKDFLLLVMKYYQKKTYEELLEFFNLTAEIVEEITVDHLLYDHKADVEFLFSFRKVDAKYGIKTDRSLPILFVQPPLTPSTFDFININKILSNYFSCRKHKVTLEFLANFPLVSSQHLKVHPFSVSQLDLYIRVPSIMIQIERYVMVNEFRGSKKIVCHTEDLFLATSTASYDPLRNSEPLETVGDSVLKLISSMFLFVKQPLISESDLTEKRIQYITNEVLMHLGMRYRVPYFLKTTKKNANEWRPPYMKHEEKIIKHELTGKQIADCVEALIGASFLYDYNLYYPTILLKQLGLPVYGLIINSHLIRDSNLIMPREFIPDPSETFHEDLTYYDMNQYFRKSDIKQKQTGCTKAYAKIKALKEKHNWDEAKYGAILISSVLARFEREILQYKFKNKAYLLFALNGQTDRSNPLFYQNYESLEFLGDSVVEIYVIANAYKLFKTWNKEITPEILQNLKISLLSNAFMARVAIMNEFHRYLNTSSPELLEEIDKFAAHASFKKKYISFVKHEHQIPKILSDIFESLAAALLYDGGWKAVHQVYGRLFGPYISFFCHYHKKMETNIVERLKQKALAQDEFIDYKIVKKDDLYHVEIEKKGEYICKATGPTKQLAKERASYKACQILGFL